ncbi:MAG: Hsp20/alpha crystallin family protein [Lentimicrobiaceae bacterium]|jgi:HSP20 family protein|nr:Hsp20/alpha crystallin family protein [Lentimicrobiaceae bacterium]
MALIRWTQPSLTDIFDNLFDKEFGTMHKVNCGCMAATNIIEKKDSFVLELALPGMQKEDFKINLENNILTISSEKEYEKTEEESNYTRREFSYGAFSRSFTLPRTIDSEKINAEYKNGIMEIVMPKKQEAVNLTKEIKIA